MAFMVRQKVVCVDESDMELAKLWNVPLPVEGGIYHVRDVIVHHAKLYLRLREIIMPSNSFGGLGEGAFRATRFRPIVERKTDISLFQKMLNPSVEQLRELIRESDAC